MSPILERSPERPAQEPAERSEHPPVPRHPDDVPAEKEGVVGRGEGDHGPQCPGSQRQALPAGPARESQHDGRREQEQPGLGGHHHGEAERRADGGGPSQARVPQEKGSRRGEERARDLREGRRSVGHEREAERRPEPREKGGAKAGPAGQREPERQQERGRPEEVQRDHGARPAGRGVAREQKDRLEPLIETGEHLPVRAGPDRPRVPGERSPVERQVVPRREVVREVQVAIVEEAVRHEEVVRLVAGARHGGDDVGAQEEVGQEGAQEDPDARARRRDRMARQPAPQAADEDRRLDADEEREPDPHPDPPMAVTAGDQEPGEQGEDQDQAPLIGDEMPPERARRIPARQERVGAREQRVGGRRPEREQPRPRVRVRSVPVEAGLEDSRLVAGEPPDVPEGQAGGRGCRAAEQERTPPDPARTCRAGVPGLAQGLARREPVRREALRARLMGVRWTGRRRAMTLLSTAAFRRPRRRGSVSCAGVRIPWA